MVPVYSFCPLTNMSINTFQSSSLNSKGDISWFLVLPSTYKLTLKGHREKLIPPVDSSKSLSYMSVIQECMILLNILSWPGRKGHRGKLMVPVDSFGPLPYISLTYYKALAWIVKEIFLAFSKFDLKPTSWPWKNCNRANWICWIPWPIFPICL